MNWVGWLGILFVALKLLGHISWSWWLVLLPFYGGFVAVVLLFLLTASMQGGNKF